MTGKSKVPTAVKTRGHVARFSAARFTFVTTASAEMSSGSLPLAVRSESRVSLFLDPFVLLLRIEATITHPG